MKCFYYFFVIYNAILWTEGQREPTFPLTTNSFRQIVRGLFAVPKDRKQTVDGILIRHYSSNASEPNSYLIGDIKLLTADPAFDLNKPTVVYAHGYAELHSDESVSAIVSAYLSRGGHNILLVDWSNLAFGNYLHIAKVLPMAGSTVGKSLQKLLKRGLSLEGLHLVGHSMGTHLSASAARYLMYKGYKVPRLTGLDPAYPAFYPSILPTLSPGIRPSDASFVDCIHTDGGGFGAPGSISHADFWPNGGEAKQPGCISGSLPLTTEDFCSHWRSWEFWAESVLGGEFLARPCRDYDSFLRGNCQTEPIAYMGLKADPSLRGNFYLRTAAKSPYALGERGAS